MSAQRLVCAMKKFVLKASLDAGESDAAWVQTHAIHSRMDMLSKSDGSHPTWLVHQLRRHSGQSGVLFDEKYIVYSW